MPIPLMAAVAGGSALIKGISSLFQNKKARKLAKQNVRPDAVVSEDLESNVRLAKKNANEGLSSQAKTEFNNNIWRNQNASIKRSQDRRSGMALIPAINQASNDSALKLSVIDSDKRRENENTLMRERRVLANDKQRVWDWNQKQKFFENADAIRALYGAGRANMNGAINDAMMGAMSFDQRNGGFGLPSRTPRRTRQDWTYYPED